MILKSNVQILNILLAEEGQVGVMNVHKAFKRNRIQNPVLIASIGNETLDVLRTHKITSALITMLLDIDKQKMNGVKFLKEIIKDNEQKPLPVFEKTTLYIVSYKTDANNLKAKDFKLNSLSIEKCTETIKHLSNYWSAIQLV